MADLMPASLKNLLEPVRDIARHAGVEILKYYESAPSVSVKADGSPLTKADMASHHFICDRLATLPVDFPILSEESKQISFETRSQWSRFWLVDPLDGTKEFIKRNGRFTVNIALIEKNTPILGVVHIPAQNITYYAAKDVGVFCQDENNHITPIHARKANPNEFTLLTSSSHKGKESESLTKLWPNLKTISIGSSIKFCLVAAGKADLYVRNKPTMEWDTAAAQCVLQQAGGKVFDLEENPLRYNKTSLLNPSFIVIGDPGFSWPRWSEILESKP